MRGRAPSLLELEDRPPEYDSVGRLCQWDDLFPERVLPRSRYERVLGHAISGERLKLDSEVYTPVGMQWIQNTSMIDVLQRHYPNLRSAMSGTDNAFAPWRGARA